MSMPLPEPFGTLPLTNERLVVKDAEGNAAPGASIAMYIWNEVGNDPATAGKIDPGLSAQAVPRINADMGQKDHLWTGTN